MTTSGTATFNLDIAEIAEDAFDRAGIAFRTGYHMKTARRSLNLLTAELSNYGINLWTIDSGTIPLVIGTDTYSLPVDTIDLLDVSFRKNQGISSQFDIPLERIGVGTYANFSNKLQSGTPQQYYVARTLTPTITIYPVFNLTGTYKLVYWRLRRMQDAGAGGANTMDIPSRFLPVIVTGLAYQIASKYAPDRMQATLGEYQRQLQLAMDEDRDRSSFFIKPTSAYSM